MSELSVRRYDGDPAAWDDFVERSNNGTIFHRTDFLAYHGGRFAAVEHPLAWFKGDALHAVMPLAIAEEGGVRVARSPYGGSYGGIVVGPELGLKRAEEIVGGLFDALREAAVRRLVVTPTPGLNFALPHDYLNFWLLKHGARAAMSELTSYIETSGEPLERFTYAAVKAIRKAKANGVVVEESTDASPFYEILSANRAKIGAAPTHTLDEVRWLLRELPDRIKLFVATREGIPIAGSLVFRVNARVLLDFYWAHLDEYQEFRPVSLLVHEITRWAHGAGIRYFDFGTQTVRMEPIEGSTRFKETFGAVGVFRTTYEWNAAG